MAETVRLHLRGWVILLLGTGLLLGALAPVSSTPAGEERPGTRKPHIPPEYSKPIFEYRGERIHQFLRTSIFEGLKADGFPWELADSLDSFDNFVEKCTICDATRAALRDYAKLDKQPPGKGVGSELRKRLGDKRAEVRHAALRELIDRYVTAGYKLFKMEEQHKAAMQKALEFERKNSMGNLSRGQTFCPCCDGACCVKK